MSYSERIYEQNPDPTHWDGDTYTGQNFYALVHFQKRDKTGKLLVEFWHGLLTEEQLEREKKNIKAVAVSKLPEKFKQSGKLFHVFGPGRSGDIDKALVEEKESVKAVEIDA